MQATKNGVRTERAQRLGWPAEQVTIMDEDQGKSGAGSAVAHERNGFAQLVSAVSLGGVGLVLVLEIPRSARNSAEWYRLLELAALAGVLIADESVVYDPRVQRSAAGPTHLNSSEHVEEEGVVPGGAEAPPLDAHAFGRMLAQQVEGEMAQDGDVLGGVALAGPKGAPLWSSWKATASTQ